MDKINKLKNLNLPEEEVDRIMRELINEKMDKEYKEKYAKMLKNEHGIERTAPPQAAEKKVDPKPSTKLISFPNFAKVAASLLLLAGAVYFVNLQLSENQNLLSAQEYIEMENLQYMDVVRGSGDESEIRSKAINSFQNDSFKESLRYYKQIPNGVKNAQDLFYQSYCQLKLGNNAEAAEGFQKCRSLLTFNDKLYPESSFYYVIALLQIGEVDKAKSAADSLDDKSWEAQELQKIYFK